MKTMRMHKERKKEKTQIRKVESRNLVIDIVSDR